MSETEFNTVVVIVFLVVAIGAAISFTYFVKWYRREMTHRPTPESLIQRQAELEATFKRNHPDVEEDETSGS